MAIQRQKSISLKLHSLPQPLYDVLSVSLSFIHLPFPSISFSLILSAVLNASSLSLSPSLPLSSFLPGHLSLPCTSVLRSVLHLSLFISVVRLLCEGLQWPFIRKELGTGDSRLSNQTKQMALWRPSSNSKILHLTQVPPTC